MTIKPHLEKLEIAGFIHIWVFLEIQDLAKNKVYGKKLEND